MELYEVTFTKVGSVEIYADSEEDARIKAGDIPDKDIFWADTEITDIEEIEQES